MSKRSWSQVDGGADRGPSSRRPSATIAVNSREAQSDALESPTGSSFGIIADGNGVYRNDPAAPTERHSTLPLDNSVSDDAAARPQDRNARTQGAAAAPRLEPETHRWPSITRKVKACAACRKQKIKCIMDDGGPPCRRCKQRSLSCKLNKSLQTLIDDESRWKKTVSHDLTVIHAALEQALRSLSLPGLPPLHTPLPDIPIANGGFHEKSCPEDAEGPRLRDPSPHVSPSGDTLAQVPIDSLYEITHLRSLRTEAVEEDRSYLDDFISRGAVRLDDAERLFRFYMLRLDPYIYGIASKYKTLESLRKSSSVLTACICAVAACHQADDGKLYEVCNQEFRRLVSSTMFDRRVSLEYLRALCIGTYWLSDISWTLSGFAVRRASDINLHKFYYRIVDSTSNGRTGVSPASWDPSDPESSIDPVRLWYLLYICDQHLSILYTRDPLIREDETIRGWRSYLGSPHASQSDMRISSQVALMLVLSQVRELFGVDASKPIPRAFIPHINTFSLQLDKWLAHWSQKLEPNEHIGDFPIKGVLLHYHFGKLHLCSHVFRGLKSGEHIEPIPLYFKDVGSTAVLHATTILELLLDDPDLRRSIVGGPHYFHTMVAFACVVLLKVSDRHSENLSIDLGSVYSLIVRIIDLLRSSRCSRYHLVHWMAGGLEKMLRASKIASQRMVPIRWNSNGAGRALGMAAGGESSTHSSLFHGQEQLTPQSPVQGMGTARPMNLSQGQPGEQDLDAGPYLPMLEALEGSEYDLNGLSFNFI